MGGKCATITDVFVALASHRADEIVLYPHSEIWTTMASALNLRAPLAQTSVSKVSTSKASGEIPHKWATKAYRQQKYGHRSQFRPRFLPHRGERPVWSSILTETPSPLGRPLAPSIAGHLISRKHTCPATRARLFVPARSPGR